jgi:hypothetical protein
MSFKLFILAAILLSTIESVVGRSVPGKPGVPSKTRLPKPAPTKMTRHQRRRAKRRAKRATKHAKPTSTAQPPK